MSYIANVFGDLDDQNKYTDDLLAQLLAQLFEKPAACVDQDDRCSSKPLSDSDTSITLDCGKIVKRCSYHTKVLSVLETEVRTVFAGVAVKAIREVQNARAAEKARIAAEKKLFRDEIRKHLARSVGVTVEIVTEEDVTAKIAAMTEDQKYKLLDIVLKRDQPAKPVVNATTKPGQKNQKPASPRPTLVHTNRPMGDVAHPGDLRLTQAANR
ncbi:MAG: hypothetical protein KW788_00975 [Candidatus Doudnabacteria bacterium]|nr:hypothetical protein [Candidatus Doudnabacteria bacterium]